MQILFDELKKIREESQKDHSTHHNLKKYSEFYISAMSEQLIKDELIEFLELQIKPQRDFIILNKEISIADPVFIRLWCLNAWARYNCFVLKNYSLAENIVQNIAQDCDILYKHIFTEFDAEAKLLPLILSINLTRISYYSQKSELHHEQKKFLSCSLEKLEWKNNEIFPDIINGIIIKNWPILTQCLNKNNNAYLLDKINKIGTNFSHAKF